MEEIFNNLTKIIKENDNFIIMTHKNPDFDGIGSAIALQQIIHDFKKDSFIVLNYRDLDKSLKKAFSLLDNKNIYNNFISIKEALDLVNDKTVLIILDTHKTSMVEEPKLLSKIDKTIVIDHHIKSTEYIKNSFFNYIDPNLSSVVEFISNYIKYLNKEINPVVATLLLVGLEIDTNSFKLKTTDKTYEVAAFLTRLGADNVLKQELLQESMENYIKKSKLIEKSIMLKNNIAMCIADSKIYSKKDLASIAEELLQFENVEASFVIGKLNDKTVGISARSIGKLNVEEIMEKLGGGGHANEAAAQVPNTTISEVKERLIEVI